MHMDLRHMRYFLAVAHAGHMTRAAEALGIQQPPLSQQIKALESELGVALFRRHPKGMSLTDAGRVFEAESTRLLRDFDTVQERMQLLAEGKRGALSIGFTSSAAAHAFTPQALRECRAQYPDIVLELSENNAADIIEAVASGRLHCGLLRVPVSRPAALAFDTLLHETAVAALPADHPLALRMRNGKPRPVAINDLHGQQLILVRRPGAPGLYGNLLALCESRGVRPQVVAEVSRMHTNLNLVAAGAGMSVVPASMQGTHVGAVAYRPLKEAAQLDAPLTLVYRSADNVGPTGTFTALLRRLAGKGKAGARAKAG
jgi:DNA-binding transcriptional LysR family regulator